MWARLSSSAAQVDNFGAVLIIPAALHPRPAVQALQLRPIPAQAATAVWLTDFLVHIQAAMAVQVGAA
jgi:hypothetical protein